jgi:hypothetical protein
MQRVEFDSSIPAKIAHQRLHNWKNGKRSPLCLACGEPATNELPTCNSPKCVKLVRPIYRWAHRVAGLTLTKAIKVAA